MIENQVKRKDKASMSLLTASWVYHASAARFDLYYSLQNGVTGSKRYDQEIESVRRIRIKIERRSF